MTWVDWLRIDLQRSASAIVADLGPDPSHRAVCDLVAKLRSGAAQDLKAHGFDGVEIVYGGCQ